MKYNFKKYVNTWELTTNFVISENLANTLNLCAGIEPLYRYNDRYRFGFSVAPLFDEKEVVENMKTIIDAWVETNPKAKNREQSEMKSYLENSGLFKMLNKLMGN